MTSLFEPSTSKQIWNFSPQSIPGCVLWLDAADSSTITQVGSPATVSEWKDKSGKSYHATQSNPELRPTFKDGGIFFGPIESGEADSMTLTGSLGILRNVPYACAFMVANVTEAQGNTARGQILRVPGHATDSTRFALSLDNTGAPRQTSTIGRVSTETLSVAASSVDYDFNQRFITVGEIDYKNGKVTQFLDGIQRGSGTFTGGITYDADSVGPATLNNNIITADYVNTYVYEVIMFTTPIAAAQRQQLEGYLAWKWGIKNRLVTPHSYRSSQYINAGPYLKPFNPLDISGCAAWFDASDATTVTMSGPNVTNWKDKSSAANKLGGETGLTPIGSPNPKIQTQNGLTTIQFEGNSGLSTTSSIASTSIPFGSAGGTYFVVGRTIDGSDNQMMFQYGPDVKTASGNRQFYFSTTGTKVFTDVNAVSGRVETETGQYTNGDYALISSSQSLVSTTLTTNSRINGTAFSAGNDSTTTTAAVGSAVFSVGCGVTSSSIINPLNGNVAEILIYTPVLSEGDRLRVEGYLAWKWGVRGSQPSIPASHPFYNFPSSTVTPFNPISLGNLSIWLDAADQSTVGFSSGTSVNAWNDKSGNVNNFTLISGAASPTYTSMIKNGLSALTFNGTNQTLRNSVFVFPNSAYTIFTVQYLASTTGQANEFQRLINGRPSNPSANALFVGTKSGNVAVFTGNAVETGLGTWIDTDALVSPVTNLSTWRIVSFTVSGDSLTPFVDGYANDAKTGTTGAFTGLEIGSRVGGQQFWNGYVGEILVYSSALARSSRLQVEGYLAWKWGLSGSLPSTHPYSKAPV